MRDTLTRGYGINESRSSGVFILCCLVDVWGPISVLCCKGHVFVCVWEALVCMCKACLYITEGSNAFECMIHGTKLCVCVISRSYVILSERVAWYLQYVPTLRHGFLVSCFSASGGFSFSLMLHSIGKCHHVHLCNRGICCVRVEKVCVWLDLVI